MRRRAFGFSVFLIAFSLDSPALAQAGSVEAQALQQAYGISASEASRRLAVLAEAAELRTTLEQREGQSFGGMYGEHQPQFRIFIALTGNAAATLAKYTSNPVFVAVQARIPLNALENRRAAITRSLARGNVPFSTDLDLKAGRVKVRHPNRSEAAKAIGQAGLQNDDVEISEERGAPSPVVDIVGGKQVTGIWTYGTTKYFDRGTLVSTSLTGQPKVS